MQISQERIYMLNNILQTLPSKEDRIQYLSSLEDRFYERILEDEQYFVDTRDMNIYRIIQIGQQYWLGENFRYQSSNSQNQAQENEFASGQLYNQTQAQEYCPQGWHLPSDKEWMNLEYYWGMSLEECQKVGEQRFVEEESRQEFNVIHTGIVVEQHYRGIGQLTGFWSSTTPALGKQHYLVRVWRKSTGSIERYPCVKDIFFSCRYLRDDSKLEPCIQDL